MDDKSKIVDEIDVKIAAAKASGQPDAIIARLQEDRNNIVRLQIELDQKAHPPKTARSTREIVRRKFISGAIAGLIVGVEGDELYHNKFLDEEDSTRQLKDAAEQVVQRAEDILNQRKANAAYLPDPADGYKDMMRGFANDLLALRKRKIPQQKDEISDNVIMYSMIPILKQAIPQGAGLLIHTVAAAYPRFITDTFSYEGESFNLRNVIDTYYAKGNNQLPDKHYPDSKSMDEILQQLKHNRDIASGPGGRF